MSELQIVRQAVETIVGDVATWGRRPSETGGFLLSSQDRPDRLSIVALAGEAGIRRALDLFLVSGPAIEQLFGWASDTDLRVRAQVHSHRGAAFLSKTDLEHGFNVQGFVTSVVPCYAAPSAQPSTWGWWEFADGRWQSQPSPTLIDGLATVVSFDARGVHAH